MVNWQWIHRGFTEELQKEWEDRGFNYKSCKSWIDGGCQPQEAELADYLLECQRNKLDNDVGTGRTEYPKWKELGFDLEAIISWKKQGFTLEQTKEWLDISLNLQDSCFCAWLKNSKQLTPEQVLGKEQQLRAEFNEYWKKASLATQQWLDKNYSQEGRNRIKEIYLNETSLVGELDCKDFTDKWLKVYISLAVNSKQIKIKNLPEYGEIIQLVSASAWLEQNYPSNRTCVRKRGNGKNHQDFGKTRTKITKLNISGQYLEGDLDLSDFVNCKELDCSDNQLTKLTLPSNPTKLKRLNLNNNNFANQDLSFLVSATNLETLWLMNTHFTGSLDYLSEMKKLKKLYISNTDINEVNIEQLPRSLECIYYSTTDRPSCQLTKIIPQLEPVKWAFCQQCQQPNTSENWCQPCADQEWQQDLAKLTKKSNFLSWFGSQSKSLSGKELIEKFIKQQGTDWLGNYKLKWIPYQEFTNIEYLAAGGFSKIYRANWGKDKDGDDKMVVLKSLTNSQNITWEFLQEIANTKLVDDIIIVPCHGISQDPKTKNYLMVMKYLSEGNLQQYLKNNYAKLDWENKTRKLENIAWGLEKIHHQNLVHHDFHSGNILNDEKGSYITDLGLSRLVNSQKEEGKIFGVLPYVAPEVLQGQPYTQASDIYSFGMIMYEMLAGLPPYYDRNHDTSLALEICQVLRPQFQIKIPSLFEDLINRCWAADPEQRPSAEELRKILRDWLMKIRYKENTQITQQIQEVDTYNQTLPPEIRFPNYEIHPQASYISKPINTQQITQLLQTSKLKWGDSKQIDLDINDLNLEALNIQENLQEETSTQAQIEIPPKSGN